jgi:hypothetical protein
VKIKGNVNVNFEQDAANFQVFFTRQLSSQKSIASKLKLKRVVKDKSGV